MPKLELVIFRSWSWWLSQFKFDKWTDSARNLWIWNDMNEVSFVFISLPDPAEHDRFTACNLQWS